MRKAAVVLGLGIAVVLFASAVKAGYTASYPVQIFTSGTSGNAGGSFGDARASADPNMFIGCSVGTSVFCSAQVGNTFAYCSSTDPTLMEQARALPGATAMYFNYTGGTCTYISVSMYSFYRPIAP
jgi:hypothetical protein